jgi:hypothetical protein
MRHDGLQGKAVYKRTTQCKRGQGEFVGQDSV